MKKIYQLKLYKNFNLFFFSIFIMFLTQQCVFDNMKEEANQKFGDQHFKTAIALIELHKIREGSYPETLKDLKYTGDWDQIVFSSVTYKKLDSGYELNLIRGWISKPNNLVYPDEFWKGLGLQKSNLKK
jgi:hypothetical protein